MSALFAQGFNMLVYGVGDSTSVINRFASDVAEAGSVVRD
jgi:hypothetical protein